ncbi:MAG: AIM24 family protein [Rhodococcus sp. (in: high G+C Gram-positive bacteria)]|nr:AIM24 family protein [Rhodococcus sp. (in: high G+C Gram-positive bacteria)]MDI6627521.1 AIM24 family protein [Rhodococcus sp. (in: high G+C Gram-positive bacteria)]
MKTLARGENCPAPAGPLTVTLTASTSVDVSALLLGPDGRVRPDADLVFYNQPSAPDVEYRRASTGHLLMFDATAVPAGVDTVAVAASLDGTGPATFAAAGPTAVTVSDASDTALVAFTADAFGDESALVCLEFYRRGEQWKIRAVGQGYADGLAGLATAFGISVEDDEPTPATPSDPPVTATAPPVNSPVPRGVLAMRSELFTPAHAEVPGSGIQKQGSKMCRIGMNGDVMARAGSMVAYQGDFRFEAKGSGGIGRALKQALSGEGVPLMKVTGRGDLFLANAAQDVHLIDLDGSDGLTINGANVLAFESTLSYDVKRVQGAAAGGNAGFFNCVFTGRGRIAITTDGIPVVLNVDQPTFADPQAAVAWSSSLQTRVKKNDSFGLGTLIGQSTGERFTLEFAGQGFVVVQPSEQPPGGMIGGSGSGEQAGVGGALGGLLGR